jgi:hypothetical protein
MVYPALLHQAATTIAYGEALYGFERLHHQAVRRQLWSRLTCRPRCLLNLAEVQQHLTVHTRSHAGVRLVPIDHICGSENRCADFDVDFRPLKSHSHLRWASIALARQQDIALPLIELVQINDRYFVRDGHHRISVAKALGQREIEAEVTVWECRNANEAIKMPTRVSPALPMRRRPPNLGQRLLWSLGEQLVAAGHILQALCPPEPNIAAGRGS